MIAVAPDVERRVVCAWCRGPIAGDARRDSIYCRKSCRQAAHRAKIDRALLERTDRALRIAYADPPYPGKAWRYRDQPSYGGEVDHAELLSRLAMYDGWALSTSARALPDVLALAVAQGLRVRVAVWARGTRPHQSARVLNGWEPVIYVPSRRASRDDGTAAVVDVLTGVVARRRPTLPTAVLGMKPPRFCEWVFRLVDARPGDTLDDLYPGSGIVGRSWRLYAGGTP